jgi:hypothetical protein
LPLSYKLEVMEDAALNLREWIDFAESVEAFGAKLPKKKQAKTLLILADKPFLVLLDDWQECLDLWRDFEGS